MRPHLIQLIVSAVALLIGLSSSSDLRAQPTAIGEWSNVISWGSTPQAAVEAIHVSLLPTGKVLFWQTWRESVGLWDPDTGLFSAPALPSYNVFCSGHTFLADGRLFVAGGHIENFNGENRADIYNPFTNTWSNMDPGTPDVPTMGPTTANTSTSGKRWYPSATTLGNGNVLVLSGDVVSQGVTNRRVQIYNAGSNSWTELTGALRPDLDPGPGVNIDQLPEYPRVFQLPDGRAVSLSDNSNDTEFLNVTGNGSWTYLQETLDSNLHNYGPAVMYDTGKVAYIGGGHEPTKNISMIDFNEVSPSWRYGGGGTTPPPDGSPYAMDLPRRQNNATILADGTVLITGGTYVTGWNDPNGLVSVAEIWDPETEIVTQVAEANESIYRGYHSTALLLPDGRVLVTGGDHDTGGFQNNLNAEIYSPAYLSKGPRPTITDAPAVGELGHTIYVETPDAADITKALWVAPGSVTHAQNWSQHANHLELTQVEGGVAITLPESENAAPLGYYMLFLVNNNGVPSVAEWVRAAASTSLPGDFNLDGAVDAADYVVWRKGLGTDYDQADFIDWRLHFGETTGAGSGATSGAQVPEPSSLLLITSTATSFIRRRSRMSRLANSRRARTA